MVVLKNSTIQRHKTGSTLRIKPKPRPKPNKPVHSVPSVPQIQQNIQQVIERVPPIDNNKKALLIGINYVGTNAELRGCINDIINMKNNLIANYGFDESNIILLTETSSSKKPTKNNIIKYINKLVENNNANSHLVFHYSGHGTSVADKNNDEKDGKDEAICPLDYSTSGMITDDTLRDLLVSPLVSGAKLMCIFDSCHSGTVLDLKFTYKVNANAQDNLSKYYIANDPAYTIPKGIVTVFSGCLDTQTSADSFEEGSAQGALTYCFLKTLALLRKNNKQYTIKKVIKNLTLLMKEKKYSQIPQISTSYMSDLETICSF